MSAVVAVEGLSKRYGSTVAVDDVSFEIGQGEIFGLLGRNGAGKTTTVECLQRLRRADRGRLRIGVVAPPWYEVPPSSYGGVESMCAWLVDGLVARGHEVAPVGASCGPSSGRRAVASASRFRRRCTPPPPPTCCWAWISTWSTTSRSPVRCWPAHARRRPW